MGSFRSWMGSVLMLAIFFLARRFTVGFAMPAFVSGVFALWWIWTLVLRVPSLKQLSADGDASRRWPSLAPPTLAKKPPKAAPKPKPKPPEVVKHPKAAPKPPPAAGPTPEGGVPSAAAVEGGAASLTGAAAAPAEAEDPACVPEASAAAGAAAGDDSSDDEGWVAEEEEFHDPVRADELRLEGNDHFKAGKIFDAREAYAEGIHLMPPSNKKELCMLYSNRAACLQKLGQWEECLSDCKKAIELDDKYLKAYNRRCAANEALGRWHDALQDLNKVIELDPSVRAREFKHHAMLEARAQEQFEKDKDEMLGKLKELGNTCLGKIGMSMDNFKMEKDPDTGSYSIQYRS